MPVQDIVNLKKMIPELSTMEDYLRREGWATRPLITEKEKEEQAAQSRKQLGMALALGAATVAIVVAFRKRGR